MALLEPFFQKSDGKPRVDDRRVVSGIIFIIRNSLRCLDALAAYRPHRTPILPLKTIERIRHLCVNDDRSGCGSWRDKTVMIDATCLKADRTASGLGVKNGGADACLLSQVAGGLQAFF